MLKGKVAVVTGASRGIGAQIAKDLAENGADVAIIYVGEDDVNAVVSECEAMGVRAKAYLCNVADFENAKETVEQIKADFGTVDILINNAGITRDKLILMMKEADFDAVMDVNLKGAFNMIKHLSSTFVRKGYGRIVNISSVVGLSGNAGQSNYSASKAGLIGLTKSVAKELAGKNVTCNAVAPGFIATDMTKDLESHQWLNMIPLKRAGSTKEVAEAVLFLAQADYVTGEVIRVDGGLAM